MLTISPYLFSLSQSFGFYSWKDPLEILVFTFFIYRFSLWLKQDQTKPLLPLFYSYCSLGLVAHLGNLLTIKNFISLYTPVILMLFILIHQELLQRNFVALKKIVPKKENLSENWLELLIRTCLKASNNNKTVHCIIEQKDSLANLIGTVLEIQAPIKDESLNLIFESSLFDPQKVIWINSNGMIEGINASWKKEVHNTWLDPSAKKENKTIRQALKITEKTDALFIRCNAGLGTFDIMAQGKLIENITAANSLRIIRHYLSQPSKEKVNKKDSPHEVSLSKKSTLDQLNH